MPIDEPEDSEHSFEQTCSTTTTSVMSYIMQYLPKMILASFCFAVHLLEASEGTHNLYARIMYWNDDEDDGESSQGGAPFSSCTCVAEQRNECPGHAYAFSS
jgi:hypothetical protein